MSRLALIIATLAGALWTAPAMAEEEATENASTPSPTVQGLVDDLAAQVSRLIADLPRPRMDLALVLQSNLPAPAEADRDLTRSLRELLLSNISRREPLRSVRTPEGDGWDEQEAARNTASVQGFELMLWLEVALDTNHIVIQGRLYETEHHLWREAVEPERQLLGQLFARARVNAELRWYLGALPTNPVTITAIPLGIRHYLALAVADLDGDDLNELILLNRRALEIRRLGPDEAEEVASLRLLGLPRAATRSRDPVGTLVVGPRQADGTRHLALRTSDHGQGMVVRYDGTELQLVETITDFPIRWEDQLECTTLRAGRNAFQSAPTPCRSLGAASAVSPFFTVLREPLPLPNAPPSAVSVTVLADGAVSLLWNERPAAMLRSFGTAAAITDLEDDGRAEVLLSSDQDPWTGDELTLIRIDPEGIAQGREQIGRVEGSVWVAGAGDVDNDGLQELLAVAQLPGSAELLVIE
jgi:hypothetical protein